MATPAQTYKQQGIAWLLLTVAFVLHVIDEAVNGFVDLFNSTVHTLGETIPHLPLPIFTMSSFIAAMTIMIVFLFLLAPFAFRGFPLIRNYSKIYSVVMFANGSWHLIGSLIMSRWLPGATSSPLLLMFSALLFQRTRNR